MIRRIVLTEFGWVTKMLLLNFILKNLDLNYTDIILENGYRWLEVVPPGADTALILAKPYFGQRDVPIGGFSNVVLSCDDIKKTYNELVSHGVKFIEKPDMQDWGIIQALFEDPDDNIFVLVERED